MRKTLLYFLGIFAIISVKATDIRGCVIDQSNKIPLEFAQLSLLNFETEKLTSGTKSNNDGTFQIVSIPSGKYTLRVSLVGYESVQFPIVIHPNQSEIKLGNLEMQEAGKHLKEVNVLGMKSQMKFELDKKVFNVDQNITASGTSASELLRNVPSVEVAADGTISLRNNSNVIIWINGRPSGLNEENRSQILEQLPAETIEKIEIISNPSAKYNPEGNAGVINIVLKKSVKIGNYGSVTAGVDTNPSKNMSVNVFLTKNNQWEFNFNAGYRNDGKNMFFNSDRWSWNTLTKDTVVRYSRDKVKMDGGGFFARTNFNYYLSRNDLLSFNAMFTTAQRRVTEDINNRLLKAQTSTLDYRFTDATSSRNLYNFSLDYNHKFHQKGHEFKAYLEINRNYATGIGEITQKDSLKNLVYIQWNDGIYYRTESDFQLDYVYPITDSINIETGYKNEFMVRDNTVDAHYGADENHRFPQYELNNIFDGNELRHSLYINISGKLKKFQWQIGLRGEYNKQRNNSITYNAVGKDTLTVFDYNYHGFYPSVFLDYHLANDNQLQLNYTRRVNRPKGRMINPFINMADSSNIEFGNPNLKPEFTNALEFTHIKTWNQHILSTSIYYRATQNVIQWVNYVVANEKYDTKYITPKNITNSHSAGIEIMSKNKLFKMMDLTSTFNLFYYRLNNFEYVGTVYDASSSLAWSTRIVANVALPAGFLAQVSGGYQSFKKIAQGETLPIWGMDAGLRKSFFNKRLLINITARDIAKTRVSRDISRGYNFYDYSYYQFSARSIGVVLTYNFGQQNKKTSKQKESEPNPLGGDF